MSNETVGPLRLNALDLNELNIVLRQIQDRIDYCYGLRGVTTVYNRVRVNDPINAGDVVVSPVPAAHLPATAMYTDVDCTVTALHTYSRGSAVPFAVAAGSLKVTNLDSDLLDGLSSAAFLILAGQAGGQTAAGGTVASENLTLKSTAHATKGAIIISDLSPFQWKDVNGVVIHQFGA